jgi:hypothetical protein
MKTYVKKKGQQGVVYLDDGRSLPIASIDDEPMGFPFTARMAEIEARFGKDNLIIIEDTKEPSVSGVNISDARLLQMIPEAKKEMGEHRPVRKQEHGTLIIPPPNQSYPDPVYQSPISNIEQLACDKFRSLIKNWHYSKGKEKKELERDIVAIASFLIDLSPPMEAVLKRIKEEETSQKRRFEL